MLKQRRILLGSAIFIAIYMLAALGWWTFSLLKYSDAEAELKLSLLKSQKELCMQKFIQSNNEKPSRFTEEILYYNSNKIDFNYQIKNGNIWTNKYNTNINISEYVDDKGIIGTKVSFTSDLKQVHEIQMRQKAKRMAWLGEGITVGIITLIIIVFMHFYLEKIIRFNQQKANFMMAVTHELKTPIAAAKLAIQTVIRNKNKDNQDRVLEISKQNIDRLSELMERVLLATQFENRLPTTNKKWINIHTLIINAIDDVSIPSQELLKNNLAECEDFLIYCDKQMIKIVFINLFTNAIKYSDDNSVNINVNSFVKDGIFGVEVSDNGIGIPLHERNHIFEKFYRIGDEKTRSRQGSGLGLYLVKQILQLHKAEIDVSSNIPQGSKFNIVFHANNCRME